jgi:hypothetical protein
MKNKVNLYGIATVLALGGVALLVGARQEPAKKAEAEAAPQAANSRIVQVTVYPNSALVTREVEVPAGQGTMELVVTRLPEHVISSSLYSESGDGARVLTTRFRSQAVKEDTREEVRKLEDQQRKLQREAQKLQSDLATCQQNIATLAKLENFTAANVTAATEKGKLDSEQAIQMARYVMDGRAERSKEIVTIQQKQQDNQEELGFVQRKLAELTAGSSRTDRDAVIVVDKANAAPSKVRLNYLVDQASWRPQYKFRAGKTDKDPVQLEYLAAVMQQSGEDWTGARLVLSTAQPLLNATPPELNMLAINVVPRGAPVQTAANPMPVLQKLAEDHRANEKGDGRFGNVASAQGQGQQPNLPTIQPPPTQAGGQPGPQPAMDQQRFNPALFNQPIPAQQLGVNAKELAEAAQELRRQAQEDFNRRAKDRQAEVDNTFAFNFAGALEQARDLVLLPEEKNKAAGMARGGQNEGPSVTYHLDAKLSIPSRADEQVVEVARIDLQPEYFYKAVPILTPHVYRQAALTNKSKYVLLPGEATMYHGQDFVGRMQLPLVAIGEQFTAGFGAEPQLQVQRQMLEKSRAMQGGNQVLSFEYRILLSSFKGEKVKLQVWDRLPHAEGEAMNVTLVKSSPDVCKDPLYQREDRPMNLLRWDVDIDPEQNGEKALAVSYQFKMEFDKQSTIGTFQPKAR